jgi:hypothetical protein
LYGDTVVGGVVYTARGSLQDVDGISHETIRFRRTKDDGNSFVDPISTGYSSYTLQPADAGWRIQAVYTWSQGTPYEESAYSSLSGVVSALPAQYSAGNASSYAQSAASGISPSNGSSVKYSTASTLAVSTASATSERVIVGPAPLPDPSKEQPATLSQYTQRWRATVSIDGVDVSSTLVGKIRIDAEESCARIATFSLKLRSGAQDIYGWAGDKVVIQFCSVDREGKTVSSVVLFSGVVDTPEYDTVSGWVTFTCTDNLQHYFDGSSKDQILAQLGGKWSQAIFGEVSDTWTFVQDVMAAKTAAIGLTPSGDLAITSWFTEPAPKLVLTEKDIIDGSLGVALADGNTVKYSVSVSISYRYYNFFERTVRGSFSYSSSPVDIIKNQWKIPTAGDVAQAINGTGWAFSSNGLPTFSPLPIPGWYDGGPYSLSTEGGHEWYQWLPNNVDGVIGGVNVTLFKRWSQPVTENSTLVVTADGYTNVWQPGDSVATYALEAEYSDNQPTAWNETTSATCVLGMPDYYSSVELAQSVTTVPVYTSNYMRSVVVPEGASASGLPNATQIPYTIDQYRFTITGKQSETKNGDIVILGDSVASKFNRAEADDATALAVAIASSTLLGSLRKNYVKASTPLNPYIDRGDTIQVAPTVPDPISGGVRHPVKATGILYQVIHEMDIDSGEATSHLSLAISKPLAAGLYTPSASLPDSSSIPAGNRDTSPVASVTDSPSIALTFPLPEGPFSVAISGVNEAYTEERILTSTEYITVSVPDNELLIEGM